MGAKNAGSKARAQRSNNFLCWPNVGLIRSLYASKFQKDVAWSRGIEALVGGQSGEVSLKLKVKHLAFGHSMEAANLFACLIL